MKRFRVILWCRARDVRPTPFTIYRRADDAAAAVRNALDFWGANYPNLPVLYHECEDAP